MIDLNSKTPEELEAIIVEASSRYYSGLDLLISDEQFDVITDHLRKIKPDSFVFSVPDWGFKSDRAKESHIGCYPVGSLDKLKFPMIDSISWEDGQVIMPKYDGITAVAYFYKGHLWKGITRGDGRIGINVTSKLYRVIETGSSKLLEMIRGFSNDIIAIRGEVVVPRRYESILNEQGVYSLRNYAAGLINRIEDSPELNMLEFKPYTIRYISGSHIVTNKLRMVQMLKELSGNIDYSVIYGYDEKLLEDHFNYWKSLYPVDGLVATSNRDIECDEDLSVFETLSIAIKFESDKAEAVVDKLEWNTGSTGRIVPTVVLRSPVMLSGALIQRVAGHNFTYVYDNKLGAGSTIEITRSGEVIPYIVDIKNKCFDNLTDIPRSCPSCGSTNLSILNSDLVCSNYNCSARQEASIYSFINIVGGIEGLSNTTYDKYFKRYNIKDVPSLLETVTTVGINNQTALRSLVGDHYGNLLESFQRKVIDKIKDGITLTDFWLIANVPGLGYTSASLLCNISPISIKDSLVNVNDLPVYSNVKANIISEIDRIVDLYNRISTFINIKSVTEEKNEERFSVAITGKLSVSRSKFIKDLESKGVKVGGVGKGTKYLICNSFENAHSSKAEEARKLGIEVVTEDYIRTLLGI